MLASMPDMKSYHDLETFQNECVIIYRRSPSSSQNYQTRIRIPGSTGYVVRSCKTPHRDDAYKFAANLFGELREKVLAGETINSKAASTVIDEFLGTKKLKSPNRFRDINTTIGKHLRTYVKIQKIDWLDTRSIYGYFDWRRNDGISENTLNSEGTEIKSFLRWCKDMGYLRDVPTFEIPSRKDIRRPHFTHAHWTKLTRHARHWISANGHPSVIRDRTLLWNYALILSSTGIRVGEARNLRWRDIRSEPNGTDTNTIIFFVTGKTGGREVVARSSEVLEYLKRVQSVYDETTPEDYVFKHRNGKPIGSFKKSFNSLLRSAGVEFDNENHRHTIYSLRHSYATFRLEEGVSVYTLARNMGTSVAMIKRFYGQTRTPDQEAELTKMRGGERQTGTILDVLGRRKNLEISLGCE